MTLNASYSDMGLFHSDYLTLFSVLVAQCISLLVLILSLGNVIVLDAVTRGMQELIELSLPSYGGP